MADAENRHDEIQGEIIHVYDGIEEADNALPRWWLMTFVGTIVFGIGYWFYFHAYEVGPLPMERYAAEVAAAAAAGGTVTAEQLEAMTQSPAEVEAGKALFAEHCAVCHGDRAEGNIGPNLTDGFYLHGGGALDIHETIRDGVGDKGMPAWGPALGPQAVTRLAAFVLTLEGTNVAGKEPEGERVGATPASVVPIDEAPASSPEADPAADSAGDEEESPTAPPTEANEVPS